MIFHQYSSLLQLVLIHIAALEVFAGNTSVQLDLGIVPVNNPRCVGGPVAGLTNTSVLVQYRLNPGNNTEWTYLADISLDETFYGTLQAIDVQDSIQFRLLQQEHGGGACNCWTIRAFILRDANNNSSQLIAVDITNSVFREFLCYRSNKRFERFFERRMCAGVAAGEVRGIITKVFAIANNNVSIADDACPGYTGTSLLPDMELESFSLSGNCTNHSM